MAPGAQVGVANTGSRLLFDCMTAATGLEVCITNGTPQGSRVLHDLTPGMMSSDLRALVAVDEGWLVVSDGTVDSTPQGVALWVVEGSPSPGVQPVARPVHLGARRTANSSSVQRKASSPTTESTA